MIFCFRLLSGCSGSASKGLRGKEREARLQCLLRLLKHWTLLRCVTTDYLHCQVVHALIVFVVAL